MYQKLFCEEKYIDLLLIGKDWKIHYVLNKDFDSFMYDHTFFRYCFHAFSAEEILKSHIVDCFKINNKQRIVTPKKVDLLNSKIMKEK